MMDESANCEFCSEQQPTLTCSDCSLNLCKTCCDQVHSKGKLADHKLTSYSCEVCSKIRSEVDCLDCDVGFCASCFSKLHSRGSMSMHVRAPRDPVDTARVPLFASLPGQLPQVSTVVAPNVTARAVTASTLPKRWPGGALSTPTTLASSSNGITSSAGVSQSKFCDGTCRTCPPGPSRPGYGLPRVRKMTKEGDDDDDDDDNGTDQVSKDEEELKGPPEPINLNMLPCQHRVNQRLFSYRKSGDGWVGRDVVGNIFADANGQNQLQFEVRTDGIFCNICPPHRAPFTTSGDMSNLRSHAKSDLHLNHLTLRLTGSWPSCKPTGIMPDGSFATSATAAHAHTSSTPVLISPLQADVFSPSPTKTFRSPKQIFTPREHELLKELGEECGWSKRSNTLIEKFAEQHGMMPRRVKAWIGNHKPTRKKYRYSTGSQSDGSNNGIYSPKNQIPRAMDLTQAQGDVAAALNLSVASSNVDGVTSYTVANAITLGDSQTTNVTIMPIPSDVVLPETSEQEKVLIQGELPV